MSENDKLKLSDYMRLTMEFEKDPTPENEEKIQQWIGQLIVKDYLPMKVKNIAMVDIMVHMDGEYDAPGIAVKTEMNKIVHGLFAYCVNLDNDMDFVSKTFGAYDRYFQYGLVKAIKRFCAEDYEVLCRMVDNAFNISNIKAIADTAELLNETEYDKWIEAMRQLKDELTPDVLEGIIALGNLSASDFQELSKTFASEALQEANNLLAAKNLRDEKIKETENAENTEEVPS